MSTLQIRRRTNLVTTGGATRAEFEGSASISGAATSENDLSAEPWGVTLSLGAETRIAKDLSLKFDYRITDFGDCSIYDESIDAANFDGWLASRVQTFRAMLARTFRGRRNTTRARGWYVRCHAPTGGKHPVASRPKMPPDAMNSARGRDTGTKRLPDLAGVVDLCNVSVHDPQRPLLVFLPVVRQADVTGLAPSDKPSDLRERGSCAVFHPAPSAVL